MDKKITTFEYALPKLYDFNNRMVSGAAASCHADCLSDDFCPGGDEMDDD